MKLLFDQNLSPRLARLLAAEVPGSEHVRDVGLAAAAAPVIWAHAATQGFVVVSKDTDFRRRARLYGHPPKVLWVRLGNCSTAEAEVSPRSHLAAILAFEAGPLASSLALS